MQSGVGVNRPGLLRFARNDDALVIARHLWTTPLHPNFPFTLTFAIRA